MNKKFFVVLVVVAAMLFTFSLVIGAKKAIHKGTPLIFEKFEYDKQTATPVETAPVEPQQAMVVSGVKRGTTTPVEGTPTVLNPIGVGAPDSCDMYGFPAYYYGGAVWGLEFWANFQDPYQFPYPVQCADVFPCSVIWIQFDVNVAAAVHMDIRPIVYDNAGTSCPIPGAELCSGPVAGFDLGPGWWTLIMPLDPGCCMYEPYFAGVEILSDHGAAPLDALVGNCGTPCVSYNDWQGYWEDIVVAWGAPGMLLLSSVVMTRLQNECVEVLFCCQHAGYCDYLTPTNCIIAGGNPAPDLRYECINDTCMLPWMGDTCTVESVLPPTVRLLAGDTATYEVVVAFQGAQDTCRLTIDPDPPCTNCVASFSPNPVQSPSTASTLTIVTDPTTPVGVYTFEVNGAKVSASIEVVELSDTCEMFRDDDSFAWFWSNPDVGDMMGAYFDPEAQCPGCDDDLYPFYLTDMKVMLYNHGSATYMDYIMHVYNSTGNPCDGPQEELFSWPVEGVNTWWTWLEFPLPEVFCVNGPFFMAVEFNYDPVDYFPTLLCTHQYYEICTQWMFNNGEWNEWSGSFDDGYMSLRALGTCADEYCPITCDMQQDEYYVGSITTGLEAGDQIVKYYDPEVYCDPVVYPYKIHDLDFTMWDFTGGEIPVDFAVRVYLQCQDSCDGPGTPIYVSDPQTTSDFFGAWVHFEFDELVCVYEPFFIGIEYLSGTAGSTPGLVFDRLDNQPDPYIPDTCHTYIYDVSEGGIWREHYDFWTTPLEVGYPFIRVSGFTNDPECDPPSCDTTLEVLWGGEWAHYVWPIPDAYGDDFFNERFEMPIDHSGRLEYIEFCFNETYTTGTPDPDFYVWMSDGLLPLDNNPPYQAIAEFHFPYDSVIFWPAYTRYYTYSHAIEFEPGEMFHVGYSHAQDPGDVLAILSDDGSVGVERSSELWAGIWGLMVDDWGVDVNFMINAVICPYPVAESTFIMRCTPAVGFATPGDPPIDVYQVKLSSIAGYNLPCTLSLLSVTPPAAISAAFDPNGVPVPCTSDVAITVDGAVAYGDYVLEFEAVGGDDQTRTCDVTLTVQAPYDEVQVDFYHGSQRLTNFGALGDINNCADAFLWYGIEELLFDASFIVATGPNNMAADFGTNYEHVGFVPTQRCSVYYDDAWPANIGYAEFFTDSAVIAGEWDSVFVIGIMDSCVDFSIKIKIYYNPITNLDPIEDMYITLLEDWDMFPNPRENWGDIDPEHNLAWLWEPSDPNFVCGTFKVPFYDEPMHNVRLVKNAFYIWPSGGHGLDPDSTWSLLTVPGYFGPGDPLGPDSNDFSTMITPPPITLYPGEKHIEIWIDFCFEGDFADESVRRLWWHRVLRYAGFYRGNVNDDDTLEIPALDVSDLAYLINYVFKEGPAPLPYRDQGDVNIDGKVDILDIVYMLNYQFIDGPPPKDYIRFIPQLWWRWSLFATDLWR